MKLWQRSLMATPDAYRVHGDGDAEHDAGDAQRVGFEEASLVTVRNTGRVEEVLALKSQSFSLAHHTIGVALEAGLLSTQQAADELKELEDVNRQFKECKRKIRSLSKAWEKMERLCAESPVGSKQAIESQTSMLDRFSELHADWLLPNFIAWGKHRKVDIAWWKTHCPLIVQAARIDERNGFIIASNFDYGSFNLRVCAVVVLLAQQGNIDSVVAEEMLLHIKKMGESDATKKVYHLGWGLSAGGETLGTMGGFPDTEGLGPRAISALEKLVLERATAPSARVQGTHEAASEQPNGASGRSTRLASRL